MSTFLKKRLASVFHLLLLITPRSRHVVVTGWPSDEGNAVETVRALAQRYPGDIVWIDAPGPERLAALGLADVPLTVAAKNSVSAVWRYLTAEAVFFTHGLYYCPRPTRRKPSINLWHGDGPKRPNGSPVWSTFVVSGSAVFGAVRCRMFHVDLSNLLLHPLPRVEQLLRPPSAEVLGQLGLDQTRPFVVWMPTYRRARGGGLDGSWADTSEESDQQVHTAVAPLVRALAAADVQLVVKPHPLDVETRAVPGAISITDAKLADVGSTLYAVLGASSGLITDYSSVWTDYLGTDQPIAFVLPDEDEYRSGRGFEPADTLDHLPGPILRTPEDFDDFSASLRSGAGGEHRALARKHFGLASERRPALALLEDLADRGVLTLTASAGR